MRQDIFLVCILLLKSETVNAFVIVAHRDLSLVDAIMQKLDRYANDLEHIITERTRELEDERRKSELLLYSMMPP